MARTLLFVAVFLLGLAGGFFARGTNSLGPAKKGGDEADLAAIEKLHKADVDATLTQDSAALTALWSENGTKLDGPGVPVVGTNDLRQMYEKMRIAYPEFKVLKYAPSVTTVKIADGWAIETGTFEATFQMSAQDQPVSVSDKGVRVLKKQADGSWKFAVVGLK
jgi:ketosteroid isomerase-like protein